MNIIRSPLGLPGSLTVEKIKWKTESKPGRGRKNLNVPEVTDIGDDYVKEIWDTYFRLLFYYFELYRRIEDNKEALQTDADKFYEFIYSDKGELNRNALLQLLIDDPITHKIYHVTEKGINIIKAVFDYKTMTQNYGKDLSALIQMLNVNVCPYCGLSYTSTVNRPGGYIRANQIDHFFPKDDYPWIALSIWNFIPSCGTCNNIKGNKETEILYPYKDEVGDSFRFRTHPKDNMDYLTYVSDSKKDFDIALDAMEEPTASEKGKHDLIKNEIAVFGINERYSIEDNKRRIRNIFRQRFIFGQPYINSLLDDHPDLFRNLDDVWEMLYLMRIDSDSIGSSPLDRLVRDIHNEIDLFE